MAAKVLLEGCFPPIPTAFDTDGRVDHDNLAMNLEKWQKTPLNGFVVLDRDVQRFVGPDDAAELLARVSAV